MLDGDSYELYIMIFNKVLKGTDLTFHIKLEKGDYRTGEVVRGKLTLKTEKSCKVRKLILFAEGKESTIITASESTGYGGNRDTTTRTYSEVNTFFSEDLSHLFEKSISRNILQDGTVEILPQNNEIPFDFTLPTDNNSLLSTYKGKHASIRYGVKATADIAKKLDVNREEQFHVINPNNNEVVLSSNSNASFNEDNNNDTIISTTTVEDENSISSSQSTTQAKEDDTRKESYSARFEQIFCKKSNRTSLYSRLPYFTSTGTNLDFDLGTIFAKGRGHFLKENSQARIDLIEHENKDTPYSVGHTIKGNVVLLLLSNQEDDEEKYENKNLRGMKITLSGIEYAFAQGLQRISTIEKYEKNIELNGNYNRGINNNIIPFEFHIPEGINQSYIGKYSEYFWGLEAKVNVAWSSDIYARTIIQIV